MRDLKCVRQELEDCQDKAEAFDLQREYIKLLEAELNGYISRERSRNIADAARYHRHGYPWD